LISFDRVDDFSIFCDVFVTVIVLEAVVLPEDVRAEDVSTEGL
jgi:hypothetical protein